MYLNPKTHDTFLLNTHLNIIFPANISESSLKLLINEHYYDKCFLKNDLEKDLYKIIILKWSRNLYKKRNTYFLPITK